MAAIKLCSVAGCDKNVEKREMCGAHYQRWRKHGDPLAGRKSPNPGAPCAIPDCGKPVVGRGWCNAHYLRWQNHGDPMSGGTGMGEAQNYLRDIALNYEGDECLIWPYGRSANGYAQVRHDGQMRNVHRLICAETHGAPPTDEHVAAHSCGNGHEGCVTKRHLRWATPGENMADMIAHGRSTRGERSSNSKLTEDEVREIRRLRGTFSTIQLGQMFCVSDETVRCIHNGSAWAWLSD